MTSLTAISLFSGCGGFDYGASLEGVNIIWANDIDPVAGSAYKSIFPEIEFTTGDVRKIKSFPDADILIGCYPCTGFSLAARRKWKDRTVRDLMQSEGNFLYLEFLRALDQSKPKYFFVENVRGMVSAQNGWFFDQQMKGFQAHGYKVTYKPLDALDYGVPQSRQRIFIVGIRNDVVNDFTYTFEKPTHGPKTSKRFKNLKDTIGKMPLWPEGEFQDRKFHGHYLTRNRKRPWDAPSYTVVATSSHIPLHPAGEPMVFVKKDTWALQGDLNRRLSWKECARIQGLPKNISPIGNLDAKYRVVGNAVPPAFGSALVRPVVKYENQ